VETLVRWHYPVDGLVFPDQSISVAEAHGLINDLTRMVLTSALAQAKVWQQAGLTLRVAVNISMDNLASLDFVDFIVDLAAKAGVPPQGVVLEVTESRLMQDTRTPLEILTRLRLKRFCFSIDDFGTGHSSLAQLRDTPFDELKIDQGFVALRLEQRNAASDVRWQSGVGEKIGHGSCGRGSRGPQRLGLAAAYQLRSGAGSLHLCAHAGCGFPRLVGRLAKTGAHRVWQFQCCAVMYKTRP